ncbi:hypothetical protein H4R33_003386 [Dimargaris cristalligena]|nr:hypothetical protein H4R33_003386 [Dimargaris cristalligena]
MSLLNRARLTTLGRSCSIRSDTPSRTVSARLSAISYPAAQSASLFRPTPTVRQALIANPTLARWFSICPSLYKETGPTQQPPSTAAVATNTGSTDPQGEESPARLFIRFVCKVCNTPTQKLISKQAYTDGVVLIQCSSCKNRHLIADNKGWFRDQRVNVEDLMKEKGEAVRTRPDTPQELQGVTEWVAQETQRRDDDKKSPPSSDVRNS